MMFFKKSKNFYYQKNKHLRLQPQHNKKIQEKSFLHRFQLRLSMQIFLLFTP